MGYRTVVMLSNDMAHVWQKDPELGEKIVRAMNQVNRGAGARIDNYGEVVQCVHADTQTLAVLDMYTNFDELACKGWARNEAKDEVALKLLKEAAEKLGYQLVKQDDSERR